MEKPNKERMRCQTCKKLENGVKTIHFDTPTEEKGIFKCSICGAHTPYVITRIRETKSTA